MPPPSQVLPWNHPSSPRAESRHHPPGLPPPWGWSWIMNATASSGGRRAACLDATCTNRWFGGRKNCCTVGSRGAKPFDKVFPRFFSPLALFILFRERITTTRKTQQQSGMGCCFPMAQRRDFPSFLQEKCMLHCVQFEKKRKPVYIDTEGQMEHF